MHFAIEELTTGENGGFLLFIKDFYVRCVGLPASPWQFDEVRPQNGFEAALGDRHLLRCTGAVFELTYMLHIKNSVTTSTANGRGVQFRGQSARKRRVGHRVLILSDGMGSHAEEKKLRNAQKNTWTD